MPVALWHVSALSFCLYARLSSVVQPAIFPLQPEHTAKNKAHIHTK